MSYEQFICAMLECTKGKLSGAETVEKQENMKNNGVISVGLSIRREGEMIAPIIYLEEFYKKYLLGAPVETLSDFLLQKSRNMPNVPACNYEKIMDFQKIKDQVVYRLVNTKMNEKLLSEVPNLPVLDFSIVFYWLVSTGESECGSVMIRNAHMNLWKLPISVLYQCAEENTPHLCPAVFSSLMEYLEERTGEVIEGSPLYILSNEMGINGATSILYPGIPGKIYKAVKSPYYLLPSSVHEFLVVPDTPMIRPENLRGIVKEVNATQIKVEELLSDHVYHFDGNIITEM